MYLYYESHAVCQNNLSANGKKKHTIRREAGPEEESHRVVVIPRVGAEGEASSEEHVVGDVLVLEQLDNQVQVPGRQDGKHGGI